MTPIFTTELLVGNEPVLYHVVFNDNKYCFEPQNASAGFRSFCLIREHDEWRAEGVEGPVKEEAIAHLEKYLLAQL